MICVADFETTTLTEKEESDLRNKKVTVENLKTRVWAWGITEIGRTKDEQIIVGTKIEDFMSFVSKLENNSKIYFHNLKFDGHFILSYLLKNNFTMVEKREHAIENSFYTMISDTGLFYSITVVYKRYQRNNRMQKITFYDSLKKLPYTIERIGKAFNLDYQKVDVDENFYRKQRDEDYQLTDFDIKYLKADIKVLSQAMKILEDQDMKKMTTASNALEFFKNSIGGEKQFRNYFPKLENDIDNDIKLAYKGGVTMVKEELRSKTIKDGMVFDVNSMYPYIMKTQLMPYDTPLFYHGQYKENKEYPLYIQEMKCEFKLKENHLPTLQIKRQILLYKPSEYLTESNGLTTLQLTNVDLDLFFKHYHVTNIEYVCGYMFKGIHGIFDNYIDYWGSVKESSTGAMRELAKLMLNSLYGKFGTKTNIQSKNAFLENNIVKLKPSEIEIIDPIYSAIAVYTTAYGRSLLLTTAQDNYERFIYCDTDSIHVQGLEPLKIDIDPNRLGAWDHEGTFYRAKFLGAKCYIEDFKEIKEINQKEQLKIVCAGMSKNQHDQVTFENFEIGLITHGKLQPKIIDGGVVLVNVDYEVKIRGFQS